MEVPLKQIWEWLGILNAILTILGVLALALGFNTNRKLLMLVGGVGALTGLIFGWAFGQDLVNGLHRVIVIGIVILAAMFTVSLVYFLSSTSETRDF